MTRIKSARLMRRAERDGITTAEVEFALEPGTAMDGGDKNRYVAILEKAGEDRSFALSKVFRNDAQYELDWYENPDHEAYADVTEQFAERSGAERLAEQLLNTGSVARDLRGNE